MNAKKIQKLIELVEKSNIGELEVRQWGTRVRISKSSPTPIPEHVPAIPPVSVPKPALEVQVPTESHPQVTAPKPETSSSEQPAKELIEIRAPMVGTFYRAPAPDADPYIKVGDFISPGQVLCIIEAMKLMNEIEAECSGRIVEILGENTKPVEYNQLLFLVEPSA